MNVMPFGKFRGQPIETVPTNYLVWVIENIDDVNPYLLREIRNELADRLGIVPVCPQVQSSVIDKSYLRDWARRMAMFAHPDQGGSVNAMKLVNELKERFEV